MTVSCSRLLDADRQLQLLLERGQLCQESAVCHMSCRDQFVQVRWRMLDTACSQILGALCAGKCATNAGNDPLRALLRTTP